MDDPELVKFAQRYADAWSSQDPEKVAAFYAKGGLIRKSEGNYDATEYERQLRG